MKGYIYDFIGIRIFLWFYDYEVSGVGFYNKFSILSGCNFF